MNNLVDENQPHNPRVPLQEVQKPKTEFLKNYRNANFLSKICFEYATSLINAINKNGFNVKDEMLFDMELKDNETDRITKYLQTQISSRLQAWKKLNPKKLDKEAPWFNIIAGSLWSTFHSDFLLSSFYIFMGQGIIVTYTYFLFYLIQFLADPNMETTRGVWLCVVYSAAVVVAAFFNNQQIYLSYVMAVQMRKAIVSAMYDKVAVLSMKSLTETNSGKLITLISADIFTVERAITMMPIILACPPILILTLFYIGWGSGWQYAGYTLAIWVATIVGQLICNRITIKLKGQEAQLNDKRMKLVNDLVTGIRTIKCYAWENHYLKKIKETRALQLSKIYAFNLIGSLGYTFFQNMGLIAVLCVFLPKWAKGESISSASAFSLLAMIYYLFMSVTSLTLYAMTTLTQLMVLISRLGEVFKMEEFQKERIENVAPEECGVKFSNSAFSWGFRVKDDQEKKSGFSTLVEEIETPTLSNLNFELKHDSLLMVIGKIGSGKSTLLYSIMDETRKMAGKQEVKGKIAYVEQEPFIFSASIQENITFGLVYDENRFKKVVEASCLSSDMTQFANGKDTIIGERGINVSGGQKARISLARALYQDCDIYLLDDPLSAVDPEVANKIFQNAIQGALKSKCVILVTHQLQFIRQCPQILILENGMQKMIGSYEDLVKSGFDADEILQNYNKNLSKNDEKNQVETQVQKQENDFLRSQKLLKLKKTIEVQKRKEKFLIKNKPSKENEIQELKKLTPTDLIVPEQSLPGTIRFQDYRDLLSFGPGIFGFIVFFLVCILASLMQLANSFLLAEWSKQSLEEQQKAYYPGMFAGSIGAYIVLCILRATIVFWIVHSSASNMHGVMSQKILRAKVLFFDSNPIGRIVTRFAKDVAVLDFVVPTLAIFIAQGIFRTLTVALTVSVINPYLFIVIFIGLVFMILLLRKGTPSMITCQGLDGTLRGPIHTTFAMIINGLVSLRSYDKLRYFKQDFNNTLEKCANATYCYILVNRWLGLRLDLICALFTICTTAVAFAQKGRINSYLLILSLQMTTDVVAFFSISLRMYAEFDNYMTSSQRMFLYTQLEQEDELIKSIDKSLQLKQWPAKGEIEFKNATMKYREGLEPSIKNLSFKVQAGMKVGIVGRTGAGKSSILQALFRLSDLTEGSVNIDDIDLKDVGLHQLRQNIAFIPQSPFLLQGTIRENLDPFDDFTPDDINQILVDLKLDQKIGTLKEGLNTYCSENNNLFSVGQKQLVCLARAIMRKTKILVLDEATANVDLETDNLIQTKLKEKFSDCTVLIIAHRLATIIDADRICVMSDGRASEYDHPYRLLVENIGDITITNQTGHFAKMVLATGLETAQSLFDIAYNTYHNPTKKFKEQTKDTFSLVDNRTGKAYEIPVIQGVIQSEELRKIKDQSGKQININDPNFQSTVISKSKILTQDPDSYACFIRGISIDDLIVQKLNLVSLRTLLNYDFIPSIEEQEKSLQSITKFSGNYFDQQNIRIEKECLSPYFLSSLIEIVLQPKLDKQNCLSEDISEFTYSALRSVQILSSLKCESHTNQSYFANLLSLEQEYSELNSFLLFLIQYAWGIPEMTIQLLASQKRNIFFSVSTAFKCFDFQSQVESFNSVAQLIEALDQTDKSIKDQVLAKQQLQNFVSHARNPLVSQLKDYLGSLVDETDESSNLYQKVCDLIAELLENEKLIEQGINEESLIPYLVLLARHANVDLIQFQLLLFIAKTISWGAIYLEATLNSETDNFQTTLQKQRQISDRNHAKTE